MMTVWKYPLSIEDRQTIDMPRGTRALSVQVQHGELTVWALVDDDQRENLAPVNFLITGTGNPIQGLAFESWRFLSTVQLMQGQMVFHVFVQDGLV